MELHEQIDHWNKKISGYYSQYNNLQEHFADDGYYFAYFKLLFALILCIGTAIYGFWHSMPILIVQFVVCAVWAFYCVEPAYDLSKNRGYLQECEENIKFAKSKRKECVRRGIRIVFEALAQAPSLNVHSEHTSLMLSLNRSVQREDFEA